MNLNEGHNGHWHCGDLIDLVGGRYSVVMPTRKVNLSEQQSKFISKRIERGGYRNANEIIGAGLRLLEKQEKQDRLKLVILRRLATNAFDEIDCGQFEMLDAADIDQFIEEADARARASNR